MKHSRIDGPCTASLLLALLVFTAGCQKDTQAPSVERVTQEQSAPADTTSLPELTGIWTVVGHHIPGVSAMGGAEASAWRGKTLRLTAKEAMTEESRCDAPSYATHSAPRDRFLGVEYQVLPGTLAPLASREEVTVLDVSCGSDLWAAMGGRLIGIDRDRALAPWNGVFFELTRDHDVHAQGQEPFWSLEIRKGKEMRFTYEPGKREVVTPVPRAESKGEATVYHAVTESNDLRVVIKQIPCTDSMSGQRFEATVTVTINGRIYHGCGGAIP